MDEKRPKDFGSYTDTPPPPDEQTQKTLGQVGFDAYGDKPGAHGPWKTFDGREMPRWEALAGETGALTRERWEASAEAIGKEYMRRQGFEWDAFASRWTKKSATGPAISPRTTGA